MNEINAIVDTDTFSKIRTWIITILLPWLWRRCFKNDTYSCGTLEEEISRRTKLSLGTPKCTGRFEERISQREEGLYGDVRTSKGISLEASTFQESKVHCSTSGNASQEVHQRLVSPQSPYFLPSQRTCELKILSSKPDAWGKILTDHDGVPDIAYDIIVDGIFYLDSEVV